MIDHVLDQFGQRVEVGDKIAYVVSSCSSPDVRYGTVVEFVPFDASWWNEFQIQHHLPYGCKIRVGTDKKYKSSRGSALLEKAPIFKDTRDD